jgi:hypothetical protein
MQVLFPGSKILNLSQFCFRVINAGPKKNESCCSRFDDDSLHKRIKMMQIKINLLQQCCPSPPKAIGAMSLAPFLALQSFVVPPTTRLLLEILPGHSTHLSGTFSYVSGSDEQRRVAVSLMKAKALYTALSMATLGVALDKAASLTQPQIRKLSQAVLISLELNRAELDLPVCYGYGYHHCESSDKFDDARLIFSQVMTPQTYHGGLETLGGVPRPERCLTHTILVTLVGLKQTC